MKHTLLFQGDSITDCGRNRELSDDTGKGYVHLIACRLEHDLGEGCMRILNRGIGGDRTQDLRRRWQEECLSLHPEILSLYIGINNTWRRYDSNDPTPTGVFESELNDLLEQTFSHTACDPGRSILIEPFFLDVPQGEKTHWVEDLAPKQAVVRSASEKFGMKFLPLQTLFEKACERAPASFWADDGVHPTRAGHQLIADAWLDVMREILLP